MPRPSTWNSPTTAIRIPQHAVDAVIALCRQLDQPSPSGFVQNPEPVLVTIEDNTQTSRYMLQPQQLTPDEERILTGIMAAIAPDLEKMKPDERWLLFSRLVERTLEPFDSQNHR